MQGKLFLSPADVASELSVSSATVLRMIHSGQLPAIRVSERIYRIPRASFELFKSGELKTAGLAPISRTRKPEPEIGAMEALPRSRRVLRSSVR
jgi:excisionase family DNA binding protein